MRADLERSGVFRSIDAPAVLDETAQPAMAEWRGRAADALVGGSVTRLADGRFDVRFKLWDVVKGAELGGQSNAVDAGRPAPGGAPHRRLHLREADRREGRVLDPHRLRHASGGGALHAARGRRRRRRRAGRAEQRRADHLAGLVARTASELAYVSFESQKAVVYTQDVASGKRRAIANFRGSNSAPAWSPDGQTLARHAVARGRLAALPDGPQRRRTPRRLTNSHGDRHRARVLARRPLRSTSSATAAAARRSTACRAGGGSAERVTFAGSYNISPAISPDGRTLAYISRQGNAFRLHDAGPRRRRRAAGAHRHQRRRESELRAERPADHLCDPRAGPRRVDDHHAGWQDQGAPGVHHGRCARAGVGPVRALSRSTQRLSQVAHRSLSIKRKTAMKATLSSHDTACVARRRRASLAALLEREARRQGRRRSRRARRARRSAPAAGRGAGTPQSQVAAST